MLSPEEMQRLFNYVAGRDDEQALLTRRLLGDVMRERVVRPLFVVRARPELVRPVLMDDLMLATQVTHVERAPSPMGMRTVLVR